MSAEVLREAARLMRERAEAAVQPVNSPAWIVDADDPYARPYEVYRGPVGAGDVATADDAETAAHIASWHPIAAVAVADSIDGFLAVHWPKDFEQRSERHRDAEPPHVDFMECDESCFEKVPVCNGCGTRECKELRYWLPIATAYLNTT